jgi:hypothetical protein
MYNYWRTFNVHHNSSWARVTIPQKHTPPWWHGGHEKNRIKGRFAQAFRWAIKLAILLKTSTFKKIHKKQTKQSRAILAYVQTGL